MSVTGIFPLLYPTNSPAVPVTGTPANFNPYADAGYLRPYYLDGATTGLTGDGSGGQVIFQWLYRPVAGDVPVFAAITQMTMYSTEATANSSVELSPSSQADWDRPVNKAITVDNQGAVLIANEIVKSENPLYLGKGVVGNVLQFNLKCSVNTNGQAYRFYGAGWVSDRPFITPTTLTP
jgi:hypothetical protein